MNSLLDCLFICLYSSSIGLYTATDVKMSYSYDFNDDGMNCRHRPEERLTYRNIIRYCDKEKDEDTCMDGLTLTENADFKLPENYEKYKVPEPDKHPIDRNKLELWQTSALGKAKNDIERQSVINFAKHVRNISFDEFKGALSACFEAMWKAFPKDKNDFVLHNSLKYTREQRNNSPAWLSELVNHMGLHDIQEKREYRHISYKKNKSDSKNKVTYSVDDASYTGKSIHSFFKSKVVIVPYIRHIYRLVERNKIIFINALDGTARFLSLFDDDDHDEGGHPTFKYIQEPIEASQLQSLVSHNRVYIYCEEIKNAFYFDHKMADHHSWTNSRWKMRGFHRSYPESDLDRTNFIVGCEDSDDSFNSQNLYNCPTPPYEVNALKFRRSLI